MATHPFHLTASSPREFRRALLATIADDHARGVAAPDDDAANPHARQLVIINGRHIGYDATVTDHPHINYIAALDQPGPAPRPLISMEERREHIAFMRSWGWLYA